MEWECRNGLAGVPGTGTLIVGEWVTLWEWTRFPGEGGWKEQVGSWLRGVLIWRLGRWKLSARYRKEWWQDVLVVTWSWKWGEHFKKSGVLRAVERPASDMLRAMRKAYWVRDEVTKDLIENAGRRNEGYQWSQCEHQELSTSWSIIAAERRETESQPVKCLQFALSFTLDNAGSGHFT